MRKGIVGLIVILFFLSGCTGAELKKENKVKEEKIIKLEEEISMNNMEMEALRARNSELEKRMLRLQKIQKEKTSEINQLYYEKAEIESKIKKQQLDYNKTINDKEKEIEMLNESIEILKKQKN